MKKATSFRALCKGIIIFSLLCSNSLIAQNAIWHFLDGEYKSEKLDFTPSRYNAFSFNKEAMMSELNQISNSGSKIIDIPLPDGTYEKFILTSGGIMHPDLAAQFPQIREFKGVALKDKSKSICLDITPQGFHAMILSNEGKIIIDPYSAKNKNQVIVYNEQDFFGNLSYEERTLFYGTCEHDDIDLKSEESISEIYNRKDDANKVNRTSGDELRTYRLAITCSGEYAQWHIDRDGGGVETVLASIVTTMNRVSSIFKKEVAVNFILVPTEASLLYLDPDTDPFLTNCGSSLNEYQDALEAIIPADSYDMGHHFCVGGGGVAGQGPCLTRKGRGRSGSGFPSGNNFARLVGHEMGHQLGASHTFSGTMGNCDEGNRSDNNAYEPGSGSTIMSYYGICGDDNIGTERTTDFYHTRSFEQMFDYIHNDRRGNSCAVITNTGNSIPVSNAGDGGWVIPKSTPFVLTGSGTDPDNDPLTYSWEQYDLGTAGPPSNALADGPLFRTWNPETIPSRTFPRLVDLVNNTTDKGEVLPATTRELNFRLTVRDNFAEGGGVNFDQITFNVTADAGPFLLTYPNTNLTFTGASEVAVTWDVANTDQMPVNTQNVNILMSEDGGLTYPYTLLTGTANDGSETIILPNLETSTARIKVEAVDNIYFDISNSNFSIEKADLPTFSLISSDINAELCSPNSTTINLTISSVLGFSENVSLSTNNLPQGINISFSDDNPATPSEVVVSISAELGTVSGIYPIQITGTHLNEIKTIELTLTVFNAPENNTLSEIILCKGDDLVLMASGNSTMRLYDSPNSETPFAESDSIITLSVDEDITYYISNFGSSLELQAGPINGDFGNGSFYANNNRGLLVNVLAPITWTTTTLVADVPGVRTIEIQDGINGNTLFSKDYNLISGTNVIEIDFELPIANDLYFTVTSDLVDLFRNNTQVNFPYSSDGIITIDRSSSSAPLDFYYFFYDMRFELNGACESQKTSLEVSIEDVEKPIIESNGSKLFVIDIYDTYQWKLNTAEIPNATNFEYTTSTEGSYIVDVSRNNCENVSDAFQYIVSSVDSEGLSNKITILPNPATDQLTITADVIIDEYQIFPLNGKTQILSGNLKNNNTIDISSLETGVYLIKIKSENQQLTRKILVK